LHAVEYGPADASQGLLLLHGYLAAAHVWEAAAARLTERADVRVVALDLPGCGYSDRPADRSYSLEWLATVVLEALRALELPRPLIVGHSLGGAVALHAAARASAEISGLVLISPLTFSSPLPAPLRPAARHPGIFQLLYRSPPGRLAVRPLLRRNFAGAPPKAVERTLDLVLAHLDAPGGWHAATRMGVQAAFRRDLSTQIRRVRAPALLLWGGQDRVHPPALGERLASELSSAQHVVLEECGHNPHLEQPEQLAQEITTWMATLRETEDQESSA